MKENKLWDLDVFSPSPLKSFLPKIRKKLKEEIMHHFWTKMPMCSCTWASSTLLFFTSFFLFSFNLLGRLCPVLIFFFLSFFLSFLLLSFVFFLLLFLFRCSFFSGREFYFLINLGDYFFYHIFCFNWRHFLTRVYA